ncbi:MAG: ribonuclease R [Pseudomonadota bacterium]
MSKRSKAASHKAASKLPSRQDILDFIEKSSGKTGKREIARAFGLDAVGRIALKRLLREMSTEGLIDKTGRGLSQPGQLNRTGIMDVIARDDDGDLIAVPAEWDQADHGAPPRIVLLPYKPRGRTPAPGIGDRVLVRLEGREAHEDWHSEGDPQELPRGRILHVLKSRDVTILGVFHEQPDGSGWLESVDKKRPDEILVPKGQTNDAKTGELVEAELQRGKRHEARSARIIRRIGDLKSEGAISLIALYSHDIPIDFPETAVAEVEDIAPIGPAGRTDLTALPFITIDPADAKDHDDAVFAEPLLDNGGAEVGHKVWVAIADVAAYVRPASALDRAARIRGNSVYFPDRVVPMLPERLSTDLCSLRENEIRPALVAEMHFGADGRKTKAILHRAMIRSHAKLAYEEAQSAIDGQPDDRTKRFVEPVLRPLWTAYRALAAARDARSPLDLNLPERRLVLDDKGHVDAVVTPERLDAHRLIEEFMIQANVAAAEALESQGSKLIYRVHDQPSIEKLASLRDFLSTLSIKLASTHQIRPQAFNRILAAVADTPVEGLVNEVVLRSQSQAEYAAENYGHFGLNLLRYAHFTSPIRRYADLIVHRALITALKLGDDGLTEAETEQLDDTSAHISMTERRAMAAERETTDRLIAHFLADRIGARFSARVSGVTRAGLFVRLADTGADGFIPAATIGGDYWRYDQIGHQLVGDDTGRAFRLGDSVDVRLTEAAPVAGALRFELLSDGRKLSGPERSAARKRSGRSQDGGPRRRAGPPRGRRQGGRPGR